MIDRFIRARYRALAVVGALRQATTADFSAATPDATDHLSSRLADDAGKHTQAWIDEIRVMLDGADSLEEFRERLLAGYPRLAKNDIVAVLEQALAVGHLAGMSDVADDD